MATLAGPTIVEELDIFSGTTTGGDASRFHKLGQMAFTGDGRKFRYVKAGGTSLVEGKLQQSAAEDTNFQEMAVQAAAAIGATTIAITLGASATTAGQFNDGILVISTTPGQGQIFTIASHDVAASGTANFVVEEKVRVALTTSSKASVMKSPYDSVIVSPTTSTGVAVGVAQLVITNAQFGWINSGGLSACLGDATATTAAAQSLSPSVTTAGAVTKQVTLAQTVGTSYTAVSISAKVLPVWLIID